MWAKVLLPRRSSWQCWVGTALVFPKQPHPRLESHFLTLLPKMPRVLKEGEIYQSYLQNYDFVRAELLHSPFLSSPGSGPGL